MEIIYSGACSIQKKTVVQLHFYSEHTNVKKILKTVCFLVKSLKQTFNHQLLVVLQDPFYCRVNVLIYTLFFIKTSKFCVRLAVLNFFFSFLRLKCS